MYFAVLSMGTRAFNRYFVMKKGDRTWTNICMFGYRVNSEFTKKAAVFFVCEQVRHWTYMQQY